MAYNQNRFNPQAETPKTTRYNRRRQREDDELSDSSSENERTRDNYPQLSAIINLVAHKLEHASSNSSSNTSGSDSNSSHSSSLLHENVRLNINQNQDAYSPDVSSRHELYAGLLSESNSDSEDLDDAQRDPLRGRLLFEQDDDYASDDDIDRFRNIFDNGEDAAAARNRLEELLREDEANEILNARTEIFLTIITYSIVHNSSQSAIADLFKMLNLFFSTSVLPESRYLFDKMFNFDDNNHV